MTKKLKEAVVNTSCRFESDDVRDQIPRELARRGNDGIEVRLLWTKAGNRISVVVADIRSGEIFEIPVEGEKPLDVFHHPYAYAAFRGIRFRTPEVVAEHA